MLMKNHHPDPARPWRISSCARGKYLNKRPTAKELLQIDTGIRAGDAFPTFGSLKPLVLNTRLGNNLDMVFTT